MTAPPAGTVDLVDAGPSFRSLHPAPYFIRHTPLNVSGTIRNNGTVTSGAYTLAFFASRDQTIGDTDDMVLSLHSMPALPSTHLTFNMAPFEVQVPTTALETGVPYYIGWRIVGGNDSNEANNAILMSGRVTPLPPPAVQFVGNWNVSGERVAYWKSRFRLSGLLANTQDTARRIWLKPEFRREGQNNPVWYAHLNDGSHFHDRPAVWVNGTPIFKDNETSIYWLQPGQNSFVIDFERKKIDRRIGAPIHKRQQLPAGIYEVKLIALDHETNVELATHHIASFSVAEASKPDLLPRWEGSLQITPGAVQPGGTVTISGLEVANYGAADAPVSRVRFFANDTPLGQHIAIPALSRPRPFDEEGDFYSDSRAPSAPIPATTLTLPLSLGEGEVALSVMVDSMEQIDEDAELNNRLSLGTVTLSYKPDLRAAAAEHLHFPEAVLPGVPSTLSARVTNLGFGDAGAFAVRFYLTQNAAPTILNLSQGILLGTVNSSALPSLGIRDLTLPFTVPGGTAHGTYYLAMWLDPANAIDEWDETNNIVTSPPVQVGPAVNLKPGSTPFALSTDEVVRGGTVTLTGSRANTGTIAAPDHRCWVVLSTDEDITRGDLVIDNAFFADTATPAGADVPLSLALTVAVPPGVYHVGYIFDATNQVTELNEDDNIVLLPDILHIVEPPVPGQPVPAPELLDFDLFKTDAFFRWTSRSDVPYLIEGSINARDWLNLEEVPGATGATTGHWLLDAAPANQPFRLFRVRVK